MAEAIYGTFVNGFKGKHPCDEFRSISRIIPRPGSNKINKRLNLFLRWVVRDEHPDLGLWSSVDKSVLRVPFGLEMARTAGRFFFGRDLSRGSYRDFIRVNEVLRKVEPGDPARYDFVLSRPALLGLCLRRLDFSHCWTCPLRRLCRAGRGHSRRYSLLLTDPVLSQVKEPLDAGRLWGAVEKHNLILLYLDKYAREAFGASSCKVDRPIDHGLRPDLLCEDDALIVGEVKTSTRYRQGPMQLKAYSLELRRQGRGEAPIGILAYGKYDEYDIRFIEEAIHVLKLDNLFREILIYGFSFGEKAFKLLSKIT